MGTEAHLQKLSTKKGEGWEKNIRWQPDVVRRKYRKIPEISKTDYNYHTHVDEFVPKKACGRTMLANILKGRWNKTWLQKPVQGSCTTNCCRNVVKWYKENKIDFNDIPINPPNYPNFHPIVRYWPVIKSKFKESGRIIKKISSNGKWWNKMADKATAYRIVPSILSRLLQFTKSKPLSDHV